MRCLLVADLHYSLQQFDWVTEVAGDFDVVIIAGDHLDLSSMVDFRAQSVVVRKYIAKLTAKTQLLVCAGNHDLDARDETGEKVSRWVLGARGCGVPCDGDSLIFLGYPIHDLPMVGWANGSRYDRNVIGSGRQKEAKALDLGSSRTTSQLSHELGRCPLSWRRRSRTMDPRIPT